MIKQSPIPRRTSFPNLKTVGENDDDNHNDVLH